MIKPFDADDIVLLHSRHKGPGDVVTETVREARIIHCEGRPDGAFGVSYIPLDGSCGFGCFFPNENGVQMSQRHPGQPVQFGVLRAEKTGRVFKAREFSRFTPRPGDRGYDLMC